MVDSLAPFFHSELDVPRLVLLGIGPPACQSLPYNKDIVYIFCPVLNNVPKSAAFQNPVLKVIHEDLRQCW